MNDINLIHHYGIAVRNMNKAIESYISRGYRIVEKTHDEQQLSDLTFLSKEGEVHIELIYSDIPDSPVYSLCSTFDEHIYHKCYAVSNIGSTLNELRQSGYIQVTQIKQAVLFNAPVCFLYSKQSGLIELL